MALRNILTVEEPVLHKTARPVTRFDAHLGELLDAYNTRISRYQMTSFLFYLCTYELNLGS